jgi:hypothetical protein
MSLQNPFQEVVFSMLLFPLPNGTATGYNKATSALLKKAITGTYPDTIIAWPMVLISSGGMLSPIDATAAIDSDGNIIFTWSNNAGTGTAKDTDKAVLVAYCHSLKQTAYIISDSRRADGLAVLNALQLKGNTVQTWMGFISADGKDAADSVYTGALVI